MDMVGHPLLFHNLETVSLWRCKKDSFQRSRYRVFQHHPPVLRDPNKMVLKLVHGMARSSVFHAKYFNTLRSGSLGGRLLRTHKGCGIRQRNGEMRAASFSTNSDTPLRTGDSGMNPRQYH